MNKLKLTLELTESEIHFISKVSAMLDLWGGSWFRDRWRDAIVNIEFKR